MFGEPAPTQGDIHFTFLGFPVRIHPLFWLVAFILGLKAPSLPLVFVWVVAVFISILVHELGHALVVRYFGMSPRITLYGMGGLTSYTPAYARSMSGFSGYYQIAVSAAGPGAGFLLAAVVVGAVYLSGHSIVYIFKFPYGIIFFPVGIANEILASFVFDLLFISIAWGLLNLLPVYPLDGGSISREVFLKLNPYEGIRWSLMLSFVTAAGIAVLVLAQTVRGAALARETGGTASGGSLYVALLFGYLAYSSYTMLTIYTRRRPPY